MNALDHLTEVVSAVNHINDRYVIGKDPNRDPERDGEDMESINNLKRECCAVCLTHYHPTAGHDLKTCRQSSRHINTDNPKTLRQWDAEILADRDVLTAEMQEDLRMD